MTTMSTDGGFIIKIPRNSEWGMQKDKGNEGGNLHHFQLIINASQLYSPLNGLQWSWPLTSNKPAFTHSFILLQQDATCSSGDITIHTHSDILSCRQQWRGIKPLILWSQEWPQIRCMLPSQWASALQLYAAPVRLSATADINLSGTTVNGAAVIKM